MDITRQLERTFGTAGTEERRVSWEAAQEIKRLRGALGDIRELCLSPPADISPEVLLNIVAIRTEIGVAMLPHPAEFNLFRLSDIPVPPMLSEAVGYRGDNRYIGFWWDQSGDELVWSDGAQTLCGGNHEAYLLFVRHPSVISHLFGYRFGNPEGQAKHALLLDRQENIICAGQLENVQHFLGVVFAEGRPSQSQQQLPLKVGQNDIQNLAKRFFESDTQPAPETLGNRMAEDHKLCDEMKAWLNQAQTHSSAPRG